MIALAGAAFLLLLGAAAFVFRLVRMPGRSYRGPHPQLDERLCALRESLEASVRTLARTPRNEWEPGSLESAAAWISSRLPGAATDAAGNVVSEVRGRSDGVFVVGAHYDSVDGSPGADDNASGVAALIELAKRFAGSSPRLTIRFVAFANEEPPFFRTAKMGSRIYAEACAARGERIDGMISIESIGFYGKVQTWPPGLSPLLPRRGDFIGFGANVASAGLLRRSVGAFRAAAAIPSEGIALPESLVDTVGWSDQWAFWRIGVPAVMVTDTALFRNPHYHEAEDGPDTLDYERMALVVDGLNAMLRAVAG